MKFLHINHAQRYQKEKGLSLKNTNARIKILQNLWRLFSTSKTNLKWSRIFEKDLKNISNTRQKNEAPDRNSSSHTHSPTHTLKGGGNSKTMMLFYNINLQEGITYAGTSEFK